MHGSLSQGFYPSSGLIAGCARARDILQSVLRPLLNAGSDSRARVYVDDMALVVAGDTAKGVAQRMKGWLRRVRDKLGKHNLLLNRDKEFMFSRDRECLNAWMQVNPQYQGTVSQQVRDMGVCVRGYAWKNHMVEARLALLHIIAVRIGMLPVERPFKGNRAQSIIFGRGLCGVEVGPIAAACGGSSEADGHSYLAEC